jgi:hypothetical protein
MAYNGFGLGDRLRNEACAKPVLGGEANSFVFNFLGMDLITI